MNDLQNKADIKTLVDAFYGRVQHDPLIGPFFNEVMAIDWEEHLPVMYSFWATLLLGENSYRGNPLAKHLELTSEHFDRWVSLWEQAVDELFEGSRADEAKMKANRVKEMMLSKIQNICSQAKDSTISLS